MSLVRVLRRGCPVWAVGLLLLAGAGPARAAFVSLGTSTADPNNYSTFSGVTLQSVTLGGTTYSASDLVQITMTGFKGGGTGQLITVNGGDPTPDAATRRGFIETDWRGDTGIINPATTAGSFVADFNTPVLNGAGVDMIFYEINTATTGDSFKLTINGNTLTVGSGDYGDTGANTSSADVLLVLDTLDDSGSATPVSSLAELLGNGTKLGSSDIGQNVLGVGIDFSDFGVAGGAVVTGFSLQSGSNTVDPVIIAAVPTPGTLACLFAGSLLVVLRPRRADR